MDTEFSWVQYSRVSPTIEIGKEVQRMRHENVKQNKNNQYTRKEVGKNETHLVFYLLRQWFLFRVMEPLLSVIIRVPGKIGPTPLPSSHNEMVVSTSVFSDVLPVLNEKIQL